MWLSVVKQPVWHAIFSQAQTRDTTECETPGDTYTWIRNLTVLSNKRWSGFESLLSPLGISCQRELSERTTYSFKKNVPQWSSSMPFAQSLKPSHRQPLGMHLPSLHWNWESVHDAEVQLDSSERSPQSLSPSQYQPSGIHLPLRTHWNCLGSHDTPARQEKHGVWIVHDRRFQEKLKVP